MDTLDINDAHYDRKILDLQRRYDEQYDMIGEIEAQIDELQNQIRSIRQEKISGDNIYQLLLAFDEVYNSATEAEQKEFMKAFIERIDMFPEKRKDGCWIKNIVFNFPVPIDGEEVKELPLEYGTTLDPVEIIEVDAVGAQPLHGGGEMAGDHIEECARAGVLLRSQVKFGGQHHMAPEWLQGLSHQLLVVAGVKLFSSISLRRVKEGAAEVVGGPDGVNAVVLLRHLPVAVGESHASHADLRYFQVSKAAFVHVSFPPNVQVFLLASLYGWGDEMSNIYFKSTVIQKMHHKSPGGSALRPGKRDDPASR